MVGRISQSSTDANGLESPSGVERVVVRIFIGTQNRLVSLHSSLFPRLT